MLNVSQKFNESYTPSRPEPDQSTDTVVVIDRDGNRFEYHLRDLYPDEKSYIYITNQSRLLQESLPELIAQYGGQYVVFEDGIVIDEDEDVLLDRIWETDFIKERMGTHGHGIYCHFVPAPITTS